MEPTFSMFENGVSSSVRGELWKPCVVHGDDVGDGGGDFDDGDGDSDDGDGDFHWDHPGDSPIHSCFSLSPRANDTSQHLPPTPD